MMTRTALVTGGASGIGRATCLALAKAGRRVAVTDINAAGAEATAADITADGGTAIAVTMDITSADSVAVGCLETIDRLGDIDILVNVASDAGRVGSSLEAVYSGAKGGTISFSKTLAREVARKGITVNVVCPGPTDTPLLDAIVGDGDDSDRVVRAMAGATAMKRLGTAEEVAPAIVYFASDEAGFTTGQTLSVSGGLTMA